MRNSWEMQLTLKKAKNHKRHIFHGRKWWTLFKLYRQQYKESISQDDKLLKVFASCFVSSTIGPWSTTTSQFLPSIWTVQDGQAAISRCWLLHANETRTQRARRAAAAALTAPSSQRQRADASDDWDEEWNFHVHRWRGLPLRTDWLSESAGSQLSLAACEKSWRALEYKAPLSSICANFLQLSP